TRLQDIVSEQLNVLHTLRVPSPCVGQRRTTSVKHITTLRYAR
ncbi:hypothetical protein PR002_g33147, partial [Phytophthora rubi]